MSNVSIAEKVRMVAEGITNDAGLELVHVEAVGSKDNPSVRIYVDKPEGITHDDCSEVSVKVGNVLDERDLISSQYTLEVSSPGIERGLYKLDDFRKFAGQLVKIKTYKPIDGQRNFLGKIAGTENEEVLIDDRSVGSTRILFDLIKKANLKADFDKDLNRAGKPGA